MAELEQPTKFLERATKVFEGKYDGENRLQKVVKLHAELYTTVGSHSSARVQQMKANFYIRVHEIVTPMEFELLFGFKYPGNTNLSPEHLE